MFEVSHGGGFDQVLLCREVPKDGGDADLGAAGDVLGGGSSPARAEDLLGGEQDSFPIRCSVTTHAHPLAKRSRHSV
jgi:hypothetical protein